MSADGFEDCNISLLTIQVNRAFKVEPVYQLLSEDVGLENGVGRLTDAVVEWAANGPRRK